MRNHLAEDVLNGEMLNLMKVYRKSLGESGARLDGAVRFLEQTSKLIAIFRNPRPIFELDDNRLDQLRDILCWFKSWDQSVAKAVVTNVQRNKRRPRLSDYKFHLFDRG